MGTWDEFDKEAEKSGQFFSPKENTQYRVVLKSMDLVKEGFKPGDEPKWTLKAVLRTLDGAPCNLKWNTKSFTIIKALRAYKDNPAKLEKITWLVKKKKEGDTVSYIFEELGELPPSSQEKAGAFI